ncbi:hypothetical protein QLQ12_36505 [Actinoplanes sp. NEAU-A12]|uniref:Exo-alpha-sialidase n=1 Tax=Actinoplanes sandaracinus TaxID=3045177 RepID=A0ABT6WWI7_9ACTN|nr:hypothetical protein [Actinoplanes sandaracinus]MDI6104108.1 hypothetical protein [Actinoplanes sandaracinus]
MRGEWAVRASPIVSVVREYPDVSATGDSYLDCTCNHSKRGSNGILESRKQRQRLVEQRRFRRPGLGKSGFEQRFQQFGRQLQLQQQLVEQRELSMRLRNLALLLPAALLALPAPAAAAPAMAPVDGVGLAKQTSNRLTAAFIDGAGTLNVSWVDGNGPWSRPVRISGDLALPRTPVALAKQTGNRLTAVFNGKNRQMYAAHVDGGGRWTAPVPFGPKDGTPGGAVTLIQTGPDLLTATYVDKFGRLQVTEARGLGDWSHPLAVGGGGGVPGSPVGATLQSNGLLINRLVLGFFDNQSALEIATKNLNTGEWNPPSVVSGPVDHQSVTAVTLAQQDPHIVTAAFVDGDGRINVAWVADVGQWHAPVPISGGSFPRGATVALAKQTKDLLTATAIDNSGRLNVAWVVKRGAWNGPVPVGDPGGLPGGPVALAKQNDSTLTTVLRDQGGGLRVAWVVGTGAWHPPVPIG